MNDFQGLIFAYFTNPNLRELINVRTAASLPFCGRYRLIDFSLSAMRNAGIYDVGVIMQRDYQSLLDHLGGGKAWDMARRSGGLRMLPPFGLPEYHRGNYAGTMEALIAVIDLTKPMKQHRRSGAEITAICTDRGGDGFRMTYVPGEDGFVKQLLVDTDDPKAGPVSLEGYIINRDTLLRMIDECRRQRIYLWHREALPRFLEQGGRMDCYVHTGYCALIRSVDSYFKANMDMLDPDIRHRQGRAAQKLHRDERLHRRRGLRAGLLHRRQGRQLLRRHRADRQRKAARRRPQGQPALIPHSNKARCVGLGVRRTGFFEGAIPILPNKAGII